MVTPGWLVTALAPVPTVTNTGTELPGVTPLAGTVALICYRPPTESATHPA